MGKNRRENPEESGGCGAVHLSLSEHDRCVYDTAW